jgi:hypothetical protein
MKTIRLMTFAVLSTLVASTVSAQQPSDVAQIERAVATYTASHFVKGAIAFDPAPNMLPTEILPQRNADEVQALANALGATRVGDRSQFFSCASKEPSTCKVSGADVVVSIGRPEVTGDTAFVFVRTVRPTTSTRRPVFRRDMRMRLERRGGAWAVIGEVGGGSIT